MKKPICPNCKSTKVSLIIYGLPGNVDAFFKALKDDEIYLGCVTHVDDPKWSCNGCGNWFGRASTKEKKEVS